MASLQYLELGSDRGSSSAGFSFANSKSSRKFVTDALGGTSSITTPTTMFNITTGIKNLQNLQLTFLGQINLNTVASAAIYSEGGSPTLVIGPNAGGIARTPPVCDPLFPYLFAEAVNGLNGVGKMHRPLPPTMTAIQPTQSGGPAIVSGIYQEYEFQVDYTPRPYRVLPDSSVYVQTTAVTSGSVSPPGVLGIYDDAGTFVPSVQFTHEEIRYTDFEIIPANQDITFKSGSFMKLRGTGAAADPMYPAQAKIRIPDATVKFNWYQVPYRYVSDINSNLLKWLNRVNQNPFYDLNYWSNPSSPNFKWAAGSLLYLGFRATRYTPPFPNQIISAGSGANNTATTFSTEKLCDIEFLFMQTTRINSTASITINQKNWINAGFNCLPWHKTRKFYYSSVTGANDTDYANQPPTFLSFDFSYLFTDPQVTHG
jgi:hypothetical protein